LKDILHSEDVKQNTDSTTNETEQSKFIAKLKDLKIGEKIEWNDIVYRKAFGPIWM